jgi:hypothetical protein
VFSGRVIGKGQKSREVECREVDDLSGSKVTHELCLDYLLFQSGL